MISNQTNFVFFQVSLLSIYSKLLIFSFVGELRDFEI